MANNGSTPNPSPPRILAVGASVRAVAMSLRRAGAIPLAADLFADRDLSAFCESVRVNDYERDLPRVFDRWQPDGWLYTGAIENYPKLVDRFAKQFCLLGIRGAALRGVRNPFRWSTSLRAGRFRVPQCVPTPNSDHRTWMRKPVRSSGGQQVTAIDFESPGDPAFSVTPHWFYQQHISGAPCSALYLAGAEACEYLGACEQLVGATWTGAVGFQYAGSVGPVSLPQTQSESLARIGEHLRQEFGLRGIFGVDFIRDENDVWPIEINPRYTASVELYERSTGRAVLADHIRAFDPIGALHRQPVAVEKWAAVPPVLGELQGKAILYARQDWLVTEAFLAAVDELNAGHDWPLVADVPALGSSIRRGTPIVTVFAAASGRTIVMDKLKAAAASLGKRGLSACG